MCDISIIFFNFELSKNTLINIECYLGKLYIIRKTFYALIHLYVLMYVNVGYNKAHIIFAFEVKLRTNS